MAQLGLNLAPEGELLRLIDLKTRKPILTRPERADRVKQRAASLAAEVEGLKFLLRKDRSSARSQTISRTKLLVNAAG